MGSITEQPLPNLQQYFLEQAVKPKQKLEEHWSIVHEAAKFSDRNYIESSPVIDLLRQAAILIRSYEDSRVSLSILSNNSRGARDNNGAFVEMDVKIIWGVVEGLVPDGAFHRVRNLAWKEVDVKVLKNAYGDPLGLVFNSQKGKPDKSIGAAGLEKAVEDAVVNPLLKYEKTSEEIPYSSVPRVLIPLE